MNNNMQPIDAYLLKFKLGDTVEFIGGPLYDKPTSNKFVLEGEPQKSTMVVQTAAGKKHQYLIVYKEQLVWVDEELLTTPYTDILSPIAATAIDLSMKYFNGKIPFICMMRNNICYKQYNTMQPVGIVWNSTGINKSQLLNYVQPDINDINYNKIINTIGLNDRGDDYNHTLRKDAYHAWIGKDANGKVMSVQTLPWHIQAAGCGDGEIASLDKGWIQINICEDALNNKQYFYDIYDELIHLTAYLCELFNIDPAGSVTLDFQNVTCPTLLDHKEAARLQVATPRLDVFHWFKKYDKNMRKARQDVINLINNTIPIEERLQSTPAINVDLTAPKQYKVVVNVNKLNIRKGPGLEYDIIGICAKNDTFWTIENHDGWGKIVGDVGWIDLQFTKKIEDEEPLE